MTRTGLLKQYQLITARPSRRHVSLSPAPRTSSSPPRRAVTKLQYSDPPKKFTDIPGPLALPMLRHSAHVLPRIGSFHHAVGLGLLEGLCSRYGDLVRLAKGSRTRPVLYVFDPHMMEEVYKSEATVSPYFDRSPLVQHRKNIKSKCPLHSGSGDLETKATLTALQNALKDDNLASKYTKIIDEISADSIKRLEGLRFAENALNDELETEVYRWAVECLGAVVFGGRLGCLDGDIHVPTDDNRKPEKTSLDDDIPDRCSLSQKHLENLTPAEQLVRCSKDIGNREFLIRSEHTLRPDSDIFAEALETLDSHFSLIEHFLKKSQSESNSGPERTLIEHLRPVLKENLLPASADIMLSGVDPLAQTALAMLYQLSLHAAQQQRAHDEVCWAKESELAGAGRPDLPYIGASVRETMRLHPATGGVVRRSKEELVVGGYEVPVGVDIVLAHGVSSKSKEWGRPQAFIPERWCPEGWQPLRASRAHPLASLPFGQVCPAEKIITKMLETLAMRILEKYRLEWHGPPATVWTVGVNKVQGPYYFVLQKAA